MATKTMEVVVCDLCKKDRPAIVTREIDVCMTHDGMLDRRQADSQYSCVCGKSYPRRASLVSHINRSTTGNHEEA